MNKPKLNERHKKANEWIQRHNKYDYICIAVVVIVGLSILVMLWKLA
mgnify:CR=1 FL=1